MNDFWNAKSYSQFLDLRTRPARDLLSAIPPSLNPQTVYDLGCGPGNSTVLLNERWPHAKVVGLDSSSDMLNAATLTYPGLHFIKSDIANFSPNEKIDCLFANASLQWLDEHDKLIPKLLECLNPGGVFAIQMPNNFHAPSHQVTIRVLQSNQAWHPLLNCLRYGLVTEPHYKAAWYYDLLTASKAHSLQIWETDYVQDMPDYQALFDWVKGTGLRPVLSAMDTENQALFAHAWIKAIAREYPLQANNHVLLPYRRLFMVCSK